MSQRPPITVDIAKWLKERQAPKKAAQYPVITREQQEAARAKQEELRERWQEREELAEREHLLDKSPRECVECLITRCHYTNDYICYRCRDAAGGPS